MGKKRTQHDIYRDIKRDLDKLTDQYLINIKSSIDDIISKRELKRHPPKPIKRIKIKGYEQLPNGRWRARRMVKGKMIDLGYFDIKDDAISCYKQSIISHYPEFTVEFIEKS